MFVYDTGFGVVGRGSLFVIRGSEPRELPAPLLRSLRLANMKLFVRKLLVTCSLLGGAPLTTGLLES
jgi:hypothetical protein